MSGLSGSKQQALERILANSPVREARIVRLAQRVERRTALTFGYASRRGIRAGVSAEARGGDGEEEGELVMVRDSVFALADGVLAWNGRIYVADQPDREIGTVGFIYNEATGWSGQMQVRADHFSLEPLGGGDHVLIDLDETLFRNEGDGPTSEGGVRTARAIPYEEDEMLNTKEGVLDFSAPSRGGARSAPEPVQPVTSVQRLLVLFSPGAAGTPNLVNTIFDAVTQINVAYGRSETDNLRTDLVHYQVLDGFVERGDIGLDLGRLVTNATARQLRETYQADLVVLLTRPGSYGTSSPGQAIGIYTPGQTRRRLRRTRREHRDDPKDVRARGRPPPGARHHPDDDSNACGGTGCPAIGFSYGRGHRERWAQCFGGLGWLCGYNRHATIMAYEQIQEGTYPRILNYSNPDVDDIDTGARTGIPNERDNARVLRTTAAAVAAFRNPVLTATATATGSSQTGLYTFTANASGGTGTYTYEWRFRPEGAPDYTFVVSTYRSFSTSMAPGTTWARVTVRNGSEATNAFAVATHSGGQPCCTGGSCLGPPICGPGSGSMRPGTTTAETEVRSAVVGRTTAIRTLAPNPSGRQDEISFDLSETGPATLAVYDGLGREVARLVDGVREAGSHQATVDTSRLPSGVYVVRLMAGRTVQSRELVVVR